MTYARVSALRVDLVLCASCGTSGSIMVTTYFLVFFTVDIFLGVYFLLTVF